MQATETERHDDEPFKADSTRGEYVVERIVCHMDDREGTKPLVWWYGYRPAGDTWKPAHHTPQHFIRRYSERQRRAKKQSLQVSAYIQEKTGKPRTKSKHSQIGHFWEQMATPKKQKEAKGLKTEFRKTVATMDSELWRRKRVYSTKRMDLKPTKKSGTN